MQTRHPIATAAIPIAVLASSITTANAALPPPYQRMGDIIDMLVQAGNDAARALDKYGLIDRVERLDDGSYRIWAKTCFVPVVVKTLQPTTRPMVGGNPPITATVGAAKCN